MLGRGPEEALEGRERQLGGQGVHEQRGGAVAGLLGVGDSTEMRRTPPALGGLADLYIHSVY